MSTETQRVVIGMDPHKRSATIEVMSADEVIHGGGRFATDRECGPTADHNQGQGRGGHAAPYPSVQAELVALDVEHRQARLVLLVGQLQLEPGGA